MREREGWRAKRIKGENRHFTGVINQGIHFMCIPDKYFSGRERGRESEEGRKRKRV
jgi:hypothetical protein